MRVNERREGVDYIWLHLIVLQVLESQLQPLNAFCHANNRHKTLQCNRKATKKSDGKEAQRQSVCIMSYFDYKTTDLCECFLNFVLIQRHTNPLNMTQLASHQTHLR